MVYYLWRLFLGISIACKVQSTQKSIYIHYETTYMHTEACLSRKPQTIPSCLFTFLDNEKPTSKFISDWICSRLPSKDLKLFPLLPGNLNGEAQALCQILGKNSECLFYIQYKYTQALGSKEKSSNELPGLEVASPARFSLGGSFDKD